MNIQDISQKYLDNVNAKLAALHATANPTAAQINELNDLMRPIAESTVPGYSEEYFDALVPANQDLQDVAQWAHQTQFWLHSDETRALDFAGARGDASETWGVTPAEVEVAREHCENFRLITELEPERAKRLLEQVAERRAETDPLCTEYLAKKSAAVAA